MKIKATQEEFDQFIVTLSEFKQLKTFTFRFKNQRVQFLDSLFNNLKNIQSINLDFKHFRKIQLKEEYKDKLFQAQNLNINLYDAIIKKNSIQRFADCIGQFKDLQNLELVLDKQYSFDLLKYVCKQTSVFINIEQSLTKLQCDFLIEITKQNDLDKVSIKNNSTCIMLKEYLKRNGIIGQNFKFQFQTKNNLIELNTFSEQDFQLQDQLPYFKDYLKEISKQTNSIQISTKQINSLLKYLIIEIDELFDSVKLYLSQKYFSIENLQILKVTQKLKKYFWKIEINLENEILYFNQLKNKIVYLDLQVNKYASNTTHDQEYLLDVSYQSYFPNKNLVGVISVIKQKSQQFLRYLIFSKYIYHLIPIPNQIFYDLIDQD